MIISTIIIFIINCLLCFNNCFLLHTFNSMLLCDDLPLLFLHRVHLVYVNLSAYAVAQKSCWSGRVVGEIFYDGHKFESHMSNQLRISASPSPSSYLFPFHWVVNARLILFICPTPQTREFPEVKQIFCPVYLSPVEESWTVSQPWGETWQKCLTSAFCIRNRNHRYLYCH